MIASTSTSARPRTAEELLPAGLAAMLDRLDVRTRKRFAGRLQGERRSKARGRSVEFEDYRQYAHGDDLRHIDWNVFARLDRFFIKVFQEEQDLSVNLVLDASASMDAGGAANKLVFGQRLVMALGYLALVSANRVSVSVFSTGTLGTFRALEPMRGRMQTRRLAEFLLERTFVEQRGGETGRETGPTSPGELPCRTFADACRYAASARTGKGVLVLVSDMLHPEGVEEGLSLLASGGGFDVTLVHVLSPGEIDPAREVDSAGRALVMGDLRLTDAESGRVAEVTVTNELLAKYRANLRRFRERLAGACAVRGVSLVPVTSDADVGELLLKDLQRRGLVG